MVPKWHVFNPCDLRGCNKKSWTSPDMSKPARFGLARLKWVAEAPKPCLSSSCSKHCQISCSQQIRPAAQQNKGLITKAQKAWCLKAKNGLLGYKSANFSYLIGLILVIVTTQTASVSSTSPGRKCYSNTTPYYT